MLNLEPIWQADYQQAQFRHLLDAMSRPGHYYALPHVPEDGTVALAILATLMDAEVSLADPHSLLRNKDWPMLQSKSVAASQADYVLCDGKRVPDFQPKMGTLSSPEQSATIIIVIDDLSSGDTCLKLTGPGVKTTNTMVISGLVPEWIEVREAWNCAFPLGVDLILVDQTQIAALPRTTKVVVM